MIIRGLKINNYYLSIIYFLIFFLTSCSYFKDKKEDTKTYSGTTYVETFVKPDNSLRGLKVLLPKPQINNTWSQLTNNEAHKVLHPSVDKKIKLFWKISIGKGQNKKKPISSLPVIDQKKIYTLDTELTVLAINKNNGKKEFCTSICKL